LESFESSQLGPWPDYTGGPIDADQIPARELTGGEGQVRGNAQGLTAVLGVAGLRQRGAMAAYQRRSSVVGYQRRPEGVAEVQRGAALGERKCRGIEVLR
jgi:hypothetical protein